MKPLFRFTVGACLQQGLDILVESLNKTIKTLGENTFDWYICYNALNADQVRFLINNTKNVTLYAQNWSDCAIPDFCWSPLRSDGSFEWNGNITGGTLWKVTPPRLRIETHEIIMDNDIILLKKFHQIEEFLKSTDKVLLLEEPIRFYGRYDHLLPSNPYFNSGFIGLPPMYDFGADIKKRWEENGKLEYLSQADEQGLLTYCLSKQPNIRIHKEQMKEILARDFNFTIDGSEEGLHFTQANKIQNHKAWKKYKELNEQGKYN